MGNLVGIDDGNGQVIYNPAQWLADERKRAQIEAYRADAARLEREARRAGWLAGVIEHTAQFLNGFFTTATPSYSLTLNVLRAMGYVSQSNFDTLSRMNIYNATGGALGIVVAFWLPSRPQFSQHHFLWRVDTFQIAHPLARGTSPIIQVMIPNYAPIVFQQMQVFGYVQTTMQVIGQLAAALPTGQQQQQNQGSR